MIRYLHLKLGTVGLARLSQTLKIEFVRVSFAVNFRHDIFVVIISQSSTEFIVIHVRFALSFAPSPGNFVRID